MASHCDAPFAIPENDGKLASELVPCPPSLSSIAVAGALSVAESVRSAPYAPCLEVEAPALSLRSASLFIRARELVLDWRGVAGICATSFGEPCPRAASLSAKVCFPAAVPVESDSRGDVGVLSELSWLCRGVA